MIFSNLGKKPRFHENFTKAGFMIKIRQEVLIYNMVFHKKKTWRRPKKVAKQQCCGSGAGSASSWTSRIRKLPSSSKNSKKNLNF